MVKQDCTDPELFERMAEYVREAKPAEGPKEARNDRTSD